MRTGVLDEEGDELINVNIQDTERVEKNLDLKKKKPTYNPYEMEEDEYGMVSTPPPPPPPPHPPPPPPPQKKKKKKNKDYY